VTQGLVVVKIGTSSLTDDQGFIAPGHIERLCEQVAGLRDDGYQVAIVTSGAISAGRAVIAPREDDIVTLQAVSAVGQTRLMQVYESSLQSHGYVGGQVLLAPGDFFEREQYLHARQTLRRLLDLGVVPIINENDTIAADAIRFGDNDRISALVANTLEADLLVILTDTPGVLTADPRIEPAASLIEEISAVDREIDAIISGPGVRGSGGMASKLAAARMAAWSGIRTVIVAADRPNVLSDAAAGAPGVGTQVLARDSSLSAKRLWIAFAVQAEGRLVVDQGAKQALTERGTSLLPIGVVEVVGNFAEGAAVDVAGPDGEIFAKGLISKRSDQAAESAGRRSNSIDGHRDELIHRDDLVLLP